MKNAIKAVPKAGSVRAVAVYLLATTLRAAIVLAAALIQKITPIIVALAATDVAIFRSASRENANVLKVTENVTIAVCVHLSILCTVELAIRFVLPDNRVLKVVVSANAHKLRHNPVMAAASIRPTRLNTVAHVVGGVHRDDRVKQVLVLVPTN